MSHHTDAIGADRLAVRAQRQLAALPEIDGRRGAPVHGEEVRLALQEFVIATRRNDPLQRVLKTLARAIGPECAGNAVREVLLELQVAARAPSYVSTTPLPRGVTPVSVDREQDEDQRRTVPRAQPVKAIEVDVSIDRSPTRKVRGPWERK